MKMTSGKRKQERQSRALDRLTVSIPPKRLQDMPDDENKTRAFVQWTERNETEIATLRQRTGRVHES